MVLIDYNLTKFHQENLATHETKKKKKKVGAGARGIYV